MSQLPKPLFAPGDHVRYKTPNGDQYTVDICRVHHPKNADEGYRYDGLGFSNLPEASLVLVGRPQPAKPPLVPLLVPMVKDLTVRELLIIQFLPDCLTLAKRNNANPRVGKIDLMRCGIIMAGEYADLYLEARHKVGHVI